MVSTDPKKRVQHLPMAEYWYNSSFHSSLQKTPLEALYGYPQPQISEFSMVGTTDSEAQGSLTGRQQLLSTLKHNLLIAQQRMKKYADRKRVERTLAVGDMVYLKLQPYRLNAFSLRSRIKLQSKF